MTPDIKNQTKRCPNCEKAVLLSLFYKNRTRSDGRGSWCAECTRKLVSTYPKIIKPPRVYVRKTVTNSGAFKRCPHCRTTKEIKFFAKSKNRPDGHSGWCKLCLKRNTRDWRDSKHVRRQ